MKRAATLVAAFAAGAVVGAAIVLALPVPGVPDEPRGPSPAVDAVVGEATVRTLLAWTPGRLPDGYPAEVRRLRAVRGVAVVRSGVAWLDVWRDAGGPPRRPPEGFQVPVEVAAVAPSSYTRFVPPADRGAVEGLVEGGAILGRTAAAIRGVGTGGSLAFGSVHLRVRAVLDDELVGAHEVVVSQETGDRLAITRPRYLLVAPGTSPVTVERRLQQLVPPGIRLRVRAPGETPVFRHGDAVLPQVRLKEVFGEFAAAPGPAGTIRPQPAWVRANIRKERVPVLGMITCHRLLLPLVRGALEDLVRRGLGHLVDPGDYGGCYYPRFIARDPGTGLSHHSWGVAIDINVSQGLPGRQPTIDPRIVETFESWGFKWGGEFLVPDGTHFEFLEFPSR